MLRRSASLIITPVGLCGTVMLTYFVRGVTSGHELLGVDAQAVLEREVEEADVGLDRAGRLDVGRVVGADDHQLVALFQERGRDDEERLGGAGRDQHVVTAHAAGRAAARRGDEIAERPLPTWSP